MTACGRRSPGLALLGVLAAVTSAGSPADAAPQQTATAVPRTGIVDEIDARVRAHFYAPQRLESLHWTEAVRRAPQAMARSADPAARTGALLSALGSSHTAHHPREDPAYWQLAGIFEPAVRACPQDARPPLPLSITDIGVVWKQLDTAWFVGGVDVGGACRQGGPAGWGRGCPCGRSAVRARGRLHGQGRETRHPAVNAAAAFCDSPSRRRLSVPHEALRKATEDSWRMIQQGPRRIAYLHVWSWTGVEFQETVQQAIARSNSAVADAFIIDLRDGWGGASPTYLGLFSQDIPVLESIQRDGTLHL